MSEVGLALLGLGRAGSFHLESIRALPGARLRQVYDADGAKAERVADAMGCRAAEKADQAIGAADVDGVIVATPTRSHHDYVVAALESGKGVLSEKPLGMDLGEIDRCFSLAQSRRRPLLVAFQRRFDPGFAEVARASRAGDVGELRFVRSVSRDSPLPSVDYIRTSGGIFHDCLVHDLDLIHQVVGEAPAEVFSFGSALIPEIRAIDDLDNVVVSLRYASGVLATVDVNRSSAYGYDQRIEVFGTAGMLQLGNRPATAVVRAAEVGSSGAPIDESFPTRYGEAYRLELACFLECVQGLREVPIRHSEVRLTHQVADAAAQSFREGRPVAMPAG